MKTVIAFANFSAEPSTCRPAPERILAGGPPRTAILARTGADGRFPAGTRAAERGTWRVAFTGSAFRHRLEGTIVVTGGRSADHFRAGDAAVSPAGFTGTRETVEPARKRFAFYG